MMTDSNSKQMIEKYLRELCLPGIRSYYEEAIRIAVKESMSYESFLLGLLEHEREERSNKRISRLLQQSKLPLEKNLNHFDMKRLPMRVVQQVKSLLDGSFLDRKENVLAFGHPGSGKTHLLCAIGQELVKKNRQILFTPSVMLVQELLAAKRELRLSRLFKKLSRFEGIIVDDIGYIEQSQEETEILFTLIAERYERSSLFITSNLPFSGWQRIFKNEMMTAAAIDRLVHHSVVIELNIESFRMKQALASKLGSQPGGQGQGVADEYKEKK